MNRTLKRFIGDRKFYHQVLLLVVPVIIQNTITNVVSLLDNVMVGQVGTQQMSAVAIVNQLLFVFNLCIFGGLAGPGIFSTQFAGANDDQGIRHCFRIKLLVGALMVTLALLVFGLFPRNLIAMYLTNSADPADAVATLGYGLDYMRMMLPGLLPFAMTSVYASTLRETGETRLPMLASVIAILINLVFNYILIFGHLGFPAMGVIGAAAATVLSRYVEMLIIMVYTHRKAATYPFIQGAYRSLRIPGKLFRDVTVKGLPLLVNEFLWSSSLAVLMQCYSIRGLDVVAATNISSTVTNLFNVLFLSMGTAVSIMVGQALGANDRNDARDTAYKLLATSIFIGVGTGLIMLLSAPAIPQIYNTEQSVRDMACQFLRIMAVLMPLHSFVHSCYFIIRSGGRTFITFLFDCVFSWVVSVPCAYILAHFTGLPILPLYFIVQAMDIIKCVIGAILVKNGLWIRNIVADQHE